MVGEVFVSVPGTQVFVDDFGVGGGESFFCLGYVRWARWGGIGL